MLIDPGKIINNSNLITAEGPPLSAQARLGSHLSRIKSQGGPSIINLEV
tara:strand:- start:164 stop:310 length:147 start_codon:yes stop_codon:yes gene_type:complete